MADALQNLFKVFDHHFGTSLHEAAAQLKQRYYRSSFLNAIRRTLNPLLIRWKFDRRIFKKDDLNLHLGCGNRRKEGYINIDAVKTSATDFVCDISRIPFENESFGRIETYHVLEHLPVCLMANISCGYGAKYAFLIDVLGEWYRMLRKGGKLIIEVPDFDRLVEEYVTADDEKKEELIVHMFGGFRNENIFDCHRLGLNKYRLRYMLEKAGFNHIEFKDAQDYHAEIIPCLRVECLKS